MRKFVGVLLVLSLIGLGVLPFLMQDSLPTQATPGVSVAQECRDFYQRHGGVAFFGSPLTEPIRGAQGVVQTFTNARLRCFPQGQVELDPLGAVLVPADDPRPTTVDPRLEQWVNAHGGLALFGPPRTALRRNEAQKRWEQHFRNLGVALKDGANAPTLLPYGQLIWTTEKQPVAIPEDPFLLFPAPFYDLFQRIGGIDVLGARLTAPYLNRQTGDYEIVFTYGVAGLTLRSGYTKATLLPIVRDWGPQLDIYPDPLSTPDPSPQLRFIPVEGVKGYNLPNPFFEFLNQHGGLGELCGHPITERRWDRQGRVIQWCANVGLVWVQQDQPHTALLSIGKTYNERITPQVASLPDPNPAFSFGIQAPNEVHLGETFSLRGTVTTAQGQPLAGVRLILIPPDQRRSPQTAQTDAQGQATFTLKPQGEEAVGTQIYRVCLWQEGQGILACWSTKVLILP